VSLGERLIELRKGLHLSQEEVADKLNVTRQTISKWETDQSTPDFDKIMPICNLYGISPDELLTGEKKVMESNIDLNEIKKEKKAKGIVISVFLYILAFLWLIISIPVLKINPIIGFAISFLIAGIGTCIIIYSSIVYKTKKKEEENPIVKKIDEIVSIITTIIYFIISFTTMMWHITWIIFLIYALIMEIIKLIFSLRGKENE